MKQTTPALSVSSIPVEAFSPVLKTFHVAHRQKYTYRFFRCFASWPTPQPVGGIQSCIGASRPSLPFSIHPPSPLALSLYGGLPITTVIGSLLLTEFASRRDFATGSYTCGSHSSSMNGLPRVSVMKRRSSGKGGASIRACNSAIRRSCATAKGPNCISNPITRSPPPLSRRAPRRNLDPQ